MHNYDFKVLDPIDFESLTNDLLACHLNVLVERFKPGKDMGIDGRFSATQDNVCIIQSKHYAGSGLRRLLSDLKNKEKGKIDKLMPSRYILSTSVPLSPDNKAEIKRILAPHIKYTHDVLGRDDLNALLVRFPKIQRAHYKLWIQGSEVLRTLLNAATYSLSEQIVREAVDASSSYVVTKSHEEALSKIRQTNTLVITGEPGVGKTTLAEQICLHFVAGGYDLIAIENDIQKARSAFDHHEEQIFYFDDFLGRNFLETLRFNEDTQIMSFIKLIQSSSNKRFVLTSRTNILDQGYSLGQFNSLTRLKNREYLLKIQDYTPEEKARILYSFMWKSGLSQDHLETIIKNKKYLAIVNHRNYNPRILEFVTSNDNCLHVSSEEYGGFIDRSLSNPVDVWEHPYSVQLDDFSRGMVDLVVLGNASVDEDSLQHAYGNFVSAGQHLVRTPSPNDFESVARRMSRTFITRNEIHRYGGGREIKYTTFNPSISDYVLNKYKANPQLFSEMLLHFRDCDGLVVLDKIALVDKQLVGRVSGLIANRIGKTLFSRSFNFISMLGCLLDDRDFENVFSEISYEHIESQVRSSTADTHVINFCDRFLTNTGCTIDQAAQLYCVLFSNTNYFADLEEASDLTKGYPWNESQMLKLQTAFHKPLLSLWVDDVADEFINDHLDECSTYWEGGYDEDGYCDDHVEVEERDLASLITKSTSELIRPMTMDEALAIMLNFDLEDMVRDFYRNAVDDERMTGSSRSMNSDVESVFDGFIESKFS